MGSLLPSFPAGLALIVGACIGALVAGDALLSHASLVSYLFGSALRDYPYVTAGTGMLLGLGATAGLVWRERLWQQRTPMVVALVMLTTHLTGLAAGQLNPAILAILLAVGLWLLQLLVHDAPLPRSAFRTLAILFLACTLLSALGAHPSEVMVGIATFLPKLAIAVVIAELLDDGDKVAFAVSAMLWAAGLIAVVALAQVGAYVFFQQVYSLTDPDYRFVSTPLGPMIRASAFSRSANQFVLPIGVACVICAYLAFTLEGCKRRALLMALALVTASAVALSVVRGTWIATLAGLALLPFIAKPRLAPLWIGLALFAFMIALTTGFAGWLIVGVNSLSEAGVTERIEMNSAGLRVMLESVTGTGISNFASVSPTFERYPVHNAPLQVGSELGFPGFVVFVALLLWTAWRLLGAVLAAPDAETRARMEALLAGYVVLVIAIQTEPTAYALFLWIYLGLAEAAVRAGTRT